MPEIVICHKEQTKRIKVAIIEKLEMIVDVEADNPQQAEQIVSDGWKNGEYILDCDNFTNVEFKASKA